MGRGKKCFICLRERGNGIAFHRIPKNPMVRPAWLSFCDLDENVDDVSRVEICSGHFTPDCYCELRVQELGGRLTLKFGSIPTILKPTQQTQPSTLTSTSSSVSEVQATCSASNVEENASSSIRGESIYQTPKNWKLFEPRYAGEISSPDISTPRRAKRCFNLMKKKLFQQTKKIKSVQESNRQLRKKILNLKDFISQLKKKKLLTENAGDSIMVQGEPTVLSYSLELAYS